MTPCPVRLLVFVFQLVERDVAAAAVDRHVDGGVAHRRAVEVVRRHRARNLARLHDRRALQLARDLVGRRAKRLDGERAREAAGVEPGASVE